MSQPASSVGDRVDNPLQKVGSTSPVVACKNTVAALLGGGINGGGGLMVVTLTQ